MNIIRGRKINNIKRHADLGIQIKALIYKPFERRINISKKKLGEWHIIFYQTQTVRVTFSLDDKKNRT